MTESLQTQRINGVITISTIRNRYGHTFSPEAGPSEHNVRPSEPPLLVSQSSNTGGGGAACTLASIVITCEALVAKMRAALLILLALVGASKAGVCPKYPIIKDFDFTRVSYELKFKKR